MLRDELIGKALAVGFRPRSELFGITEKQAARIVDALEVVKLHEYIGLLERGLSSYEARATVWRDASDEEDC